MANWPEVLYMLVMHPIIGRHPNVRFTINIIIIIIMIMYIQNTMENHEVLPTTTSDFMLQQFFLVSLLVLVMAIM